MLDRDKFQSTLPSSEIEARAQVAALLEQTQRGGKGALSVMISKAKNRTKGQLIANALISALFYSVVLLLVFVLVSGIMAKRRNEVPTVFGYSIFQVETGSMVPTLPIGSYILTRTPADPAGLEAGQIITFHFIDGTTVTHRIIEVVADDNGGVAYRTKGDNPANDPDLELLTPDRVMREFVFAITLPSIWGV